MKVLFIIVSSVLLVIRLVLLSVGDLLLLDGWLVFWDWYLGDWLGYKLCLCYSLVGLIYCIYPLAYTHHYRQHTP